MENIIDLQRKDLQKIQSECDDCESKLIDLADNYLERRFRYNSVSDILTELWSQSKYNPELKGVFEKILETREDVEKMFDYDDNGSYRFITSRQINK